MGTLGAARPPEPALKPKRRRRESCAYISDRMSLFFAHMRLMTSRTSDTVMKRGLHRMRDHDFAQLCTW